ncbi:MAG: alanine--tRNA ligase [Acidimicrobiia bacterium]
MPPRIASTADGLRAAFCDFFSARAHTVVPSASLIPIDATLLFTNSGMVPFKAYFVGDETPPFRRAASVQKCVRAGGKHNDLDDVGRTNRHFTFFEMLGNFSFGDYFKTEAIRWAWELYTEVLGLDPDRLWATVHTTDDEAEQIWRDVVGMPAEKVQRLGDDNFWRMADTGPCGPSSEIFWDLGPDHGDPGGPAKNEDRYVEIWNLVFMQYDARPDGELVPLPAPSVDTGAGLERNLAVLQGVDSAWEVDVFEPLLAAAERVTGLRYGGFPGADADVSLRILAEHGRSMTFLVADGVVPSNEERGYVLRRIIRRAVRHAFLLGSEDLVTPPLVDATVATMGAAYPELVKQHRLVVDIVRREEERFRTTLARGLDFLDGVLRDGDVGGEEAFFLHDTLGFPIDLTREIAEERGRGLDLDGFRARMAEQRTRAKEAHQAAGGTGDAPLALYRELLDELGATDFTGRREYETRDAVVGAIVVGSDRLAQAGAGTDVVVFLDRSPFYAESGGQIGDTGVLEGSDGTRVRVTDTQYALPGLVAHRGVVEAGAIREGDAVTASIDGARRDAIRRNHTATHLLHWGLREVLGSHVQQAGSFVGPDRLRFDFSHFEAMTPDELARVEALANAEVITDAPVRHYETTKDHAAAIGAIAFFGDKYGDLVRVLEAGEHSVELCGGTHVHALGFIGPIKIVSEGSIGANLRRIEAVTGAGALDHIRHEEEVLRTAARALAVKPDELPERVERLVAELKAARQEIAAQQARAAAGEAVELAAAADGHVVALRRDLANDDLRRLALATRDALGSGVVALVGVVPPDGAKAAIAVAVTADLVARGVSAAEIAGDAARLLGGGTAKSADAVVGGGPRADQVDAALALVRERAHAAVQPVVQPS